MDYTFGSIFINLFMYDQIYLTYAHNNEFLDTNNCADVLILKAPIV